MAEFNIPTETVTLPSKGLLYPKESPLSKGEIEMKYMGAKEEDILTNPNYIRQGTVIDKLLQSMIVTKDVDYNSLLVGDKNAILIAARILGYGKDYNIEYKGKEVTVDLTQLKDKEVNLDLLSSGTNDFPFTLPKTSTQITFKLLTHSDEQKIDAEVKGLKKINPEGSTEVTTRLKFMITSVNGNRDTKAIREFIDSGYLLAPDARELRKYYASIQPGIDMKFIPNDVDYVGEGIDVPISLNFFWPDSKL